MSAKKETVLYGIPASPGVAIGEVLVVSASCASFREPEIKSVLPENIEAELIRFGDALERTRHELQEMQKRLQNDLDIKEADIFDAHLLIVDDRMIRREVEQLVNGSLYSCDYAFYLTARRYISAIAAMNDKYFRERADDIKDVACRILSNLTGSASSELESLPGPRIVAARELTPSATATIDRAHIQAFVVGSGSQASHTAILARSMKIPAVVGVKDLHDQVEDGCTVIVDGYSGAIVLYPTESTVKLYRQKEARDEKLFTDLLHESRLRPETIDGYCIQLAANIDNLSDIDNARQFGAAGVGLFRTEYLFLYHKQHPDEEEQFCVYRKMLEGMKGYPVTIRTLDVGGDKLMESLSSMAEPNPFLGLRAVRLFLRERPELLRTQLRAMLRAGLYGSLKIMFPMISCIAEVLALKEMLEDIKRELRQERVSFSEDCEVGIMIETPAAALIADTLAEMVDFFSIGSNDLTQYTLAVDRSNEKVSYLYQPAHPAVLQLVMRTVEAARNRNICVGLCGEMAGNPVYLPLLLGMGIHELSVTPVALGAIRRVVRHIKMYEAEEIVRQALAGVDAETTMRACRELVERAAPDIFEISGQSVAE